MAKDKQAVGRVAPRGYRVPMVAQDPSVTWGQGVLLGDVEVPNERCAPGPRGARVQVVDYDATGNQFYAPATLPNFADERALKEYRIGCLPSSKVREHTANADPSRKVLRNREVMRDAVPRQCGVRSAAGPCAVGSRGPVLIQIG